MSRAADPPRSRRVIRLIAAERAVRGLLLLAAGVYLFFHLTSDFGRLAQQLMRAIELDPRRPFWHRVITYLHHLHASELRIAAFVAIGYGVLEVVEGTGLWLDQLWAEYLTVIATSLCSRSRSMSSCATRASGSPGDRRQRRDRRVPRPAPGAAIEVPT